MTQDEEEPKDQEEIQRELERRLSAVPPPPNVPEAPRLARVQRPQPKQPQGTGFGAPGGMRNLALAGQLASAFTAPILILTLGGYLLDSRLHHSTPYLLLVGMLVGLVAGTLAAIRIFRSLK